MMTALLLYRLLQPGLLVGSDRQGGARAGERADFLTLAGLDPPDFSRSFKDRRALGVFVGLTGTPYNSGSAKAKQDSRQDPQGRARAARRL
jgi:hypothetical protein